MSEMGRRDFLRALAVSALAAGVLPVGFPTEAREPWYWYAFVDDDGSIHGYMEANGPYHLEPNAAPVRRVSYQQFKRIVAEFQEDREERFRQLFLREGG